MKKAFLVIIAALSTNVLKAQTSTDVSAIFKMWMFLDKENVQFRGMDTMLVKDDSLYRVYFDVNVLSIDTLKSSGKLSQYPFNRQLACQFFRVNLTKQGLSRKLVKDEGQYLSNGSGMTDVFILAIDLRTSRSYRISGFNQSDFLGFLMDIKKAYNDALYGQKKLTTKEFLDSYQVEGVDFKCLNDGLRMNYRDVYKYPCLRRNSDPFEVHVPKRYEE